MSELVKRTFSGVVFVGCVVGCIVWNQWTVSGLILVISLLAVDEFHRLVKSHSLQRVYAAASVVVMWLMTIFNTYPLVFAFAALYLSVLCFGLVDEIWNHSGKPLQVWGNMLISQIMIAFPLLVLKFLYLLDMRLLLALFVLIWVNDTGAYCIGTLTAKRPQGNHKMTPHISPNKSWEGLAGGVLAAVLASVILYFCGWFGTFGSHITIALLFGLLTSLFATMGDLMESLFKRSLDIKDSGVFLPGHGGVLDRFDSVLLAGPVLTSFAWICYFLVPLL